MFIGLRVSHGFSPTRALPQQGFGSTEPGQERAHFVCWFFHDRKSKMIPTAFSAAGAIYSEICDKPADEFVYCPNAIPALRQVSV